MRQKHLFILFLFIIGQNIQILAYSPPVLEWQNCYGGSNTDLGSKIINAEGGGLWLLGNVDSQNGCVNAGHGSTDLWLTRIDEEGTIVWQKSFGGSSIDFGSSICLKNNKLFIAGYSSSSNGDLTLNHGGFDAWLICVDTSGTLIWQRSIGGSGPDLIYAMIPTSDNALLLGGGSYSNDGNVSGNHGNQDFWLVKADANGTLLWQKSLGGSNLDVCYSLLEDSTGHLYAAGASNSSDGDIAQNRGNYDWMITKLDLAGNSSWVKTYGGSGFEAAQCMVQKDATTVLIGGYTNSTDGDISTAYGYSDAWYMTLSSSGTMLSEKSIGGSGSDNLFQITKTIDGGFLFCSGSSSTDNDLYNNQGQEDIWIYKVDRNFNPVWTESYGGSGNDRPTSILENAQDDIYFTGYTFSNNLNVSGNHGASDIWLCHLSCRNPYVFIQSGAIEFCTGDSVSLSAVANDYSRLSWIADGNLVSETSDPVMIHFPVSGTYTVELQASSCANSNTNTVTLLASPCNLPNPQFAASQTQTCTNSSVTFSDQSSGNVIGWQWYFDGGTPSTSNVQNPVVTYSQPGQYGVSLIVTNSNGSQAATIMNYIHVIASPQIPVVSLSGNTISTSSFSAYTWIFNSTALPYSNVQSFTVTQDGYYQVLVNNGAQCSALSDSIYVGINKVSNVYDEKSILIYPNPSAGIVNVSISNQNISKLELQDIAGHSVISQSVENKNSGRIDLSHLSAGIYILSIHCEDGKIISQKITRE